MEEGLLAQLVDGKLILSPTPTTLHQRVIGKLFILLNDLEGEIFFSPVDLYIDDHNVLQPDLVFISPERIDIITQRGIEGVPNLVVEVLSPSNVFVDRNAKRVKYLDLGVTEYWIIDPVNETLEIYTSEDYDSPRLHLIKSGQLNSLVSDSISFDLSELF